MIESIGRYIEEHRFFKGLAPRYVEVLTGCASNRRYNAGDFIFRQGDPASHFYLIRHGSVSIEVSGGDRGSLILQTLSADDVLGWAWIVPPYVHRFDARVATLTRVTALDGACLRGKFDADPDLGYEMLRRFVAVMTDRLEMTRLQLLDLYGSHAATA